jgi:hypothetical protein
MQKVGSTRQNSLSDAALLRRKQKDINRRSLQKHDSHFLPSSYIAVPARIGR